MIKPIAMRCTQEQFEAIKPILINSNLKIEDIGSFENCQHLTNNVGGNNGVISNLPSYSWYDRKREVFEEWNQDTFLEYCGIKTEQKTNNMGYKLTVPATEVLKLHAVACTTWKETISKDFLPRILENQNITFLKEEVDKMFLASTREQKTLLKEIFGENKSVIDYTRLKMGSKVLIVHTNRHCSGFKNIDASKPVEIIFYRTPHSINEYGKFTLSGCYDSYITFTQDSNFVLFSSHEEINYIDKVIEY